MDSKKSLHKYLDFTAAEQYKLLRTNIMFALHDKEKCPIIGVTSSVRGEGKSTTAVNLSYVLAENGKKVLLIDGDLRIPSVAKKMEIDSSPGLTNMLMDYESQKMSVFKSNFLDNWFILPAGDLPPNPSELLSSKRMKTVLQQLSDKFDYIIIDLPPVNIVSDAGTYTVEHGFFSNFSAVLTCISNVGPAFEAVGPYSSFAGYSDFSTVVLTLTMMLGRLEILPVLILFNKRTWQKI